MKPILLSSWSSKSQIITFRSFSSLQHLMRRSHVPKQQIWRAEEQRNRTPALSNQVFDFSRLGNRKNKFLVSWRPRWLRSNKDIGHRLLKAKPYLVQFSESCRDFWDWQHLRTRSDNNGRKTWCYNSCFGHQRKRKELHFPKSWREGNFSSSGRPWNEEYLSISLFSASNKKKKEPAVRPN